MNHRALIVEDDLSLKPLWEIIFKRRMENWKFDWAISSEEGRKFMRAKNEAHDQYGLIIVDLFLAGSETGFDFLASEEVRRSASPVVLVSGVEADLIKNNYKYILLDTPVLSKPLNVPKCERLLDQILSGASP